MVMKIIIRLLLDLGGGGEPGRAMRGTSAVATTTGAIAIPQADRRKAPIL
jgi:hypothetical protein